MTKPSKADALRSYLREGRHLIDPKKGLDATNIKALRTIASELGMQRANVYTQVRSEFPEIAEARSVPKRRAARTVRKVKQPQFVAYMESGGHLRRDEDPDEDWRDGVIDLDKVKSQREIAQEVGIDLSTTNKWLHALYPPLAQKLASRKWFHPGH